MRFMSGGSEVPFIVRDRNRIGRNQLGVRCLAEVGDFRLQPASDRGDGEVIRQCASRSMDAP
jgi:hypothetical protein